MADFKLKPNQAALILESSEDGDINVEIAMPNDGAEDGVLASALCKVIAQKLVSDEQFQAEIMAELDEGLGSQYNKPTFFLKGYWARNIKIFNEITSLAGNPLQKSQKTPTLLYW